MPRVVYNHEHEFASVAVDNAESDSATMTPSSPFLRSSDIRNQFPTFREKHFLSERVWHNVREQLLDDCPAASRQIRGGVPTHHSMRVSTRYGVLRVCVTVPVRNVCGCSAVGSIDSNLRLNVRSASSRCWRDERLPLSCSVDISYSAVLLVATTWLRSAGSRGDLDVSIPA